ncbi:hypothetical protein [Methylophaga pinxianii]|uniref:hypothetical protein n=1 Tax=Methylophaga pinxianii TaxID=2881052 RepID=UPI001CF4F378|nr:hypothetical protein [Methylophaga pinxianii]MCB2426488.1 hypothetical protein [Methylophaga pinxianii]UPH46869.1 hypothetical protein LGT42_006175 [Methylophaga pinxianii]
MKNTHKLVFVSMLAALYNAPTMAATCIPGGTIDSPTLICTPTDSGNIDDDRDNLSVTVQSGAEIVRASGRPVQLEGSNQSLNNQGLIESGDDDAIRGKGVNLTIDNSGTISGGDRGIRLQDDADNFTLINRETGVISAENQAVRLDNDFALENANITNYGLIESADGRAIQSRGPGTTVINHGTLRGGEEVIEAREDFTLENHGTIGLNGLSWDADTKTWTNAGATDDEDGVQFASGEANNYGVIIGSDDGIDIDEGKVHNHATGAIVSTGSLSDPLEGGNGIDVDSLYEPSVGEVREAGPLTIINEGYIEGVHAIGTDGASTSQITIENSGTLVGRSGTAIQFAPNQGDSSLLLSGNSEIIGDVIFGAGDDMLVVDGLTSNMLSTGIFDGGRGENSVFFNDFSLADILSFDMTDALIYMSFGIAGDELFSGKFTNFSSWTFGTDGSFSTEALASQFMNPSAVPLPAALPLFAFGLFGLWAGRARLLG